MTFKDKARIVITSSVAHKFGSIRWHDLNSTQSYNAGSAYAQSKLANVLYANALARKLQVNSIIDWELEKETNLIHYLKRGIIK